MEGRDATRVRVKRLIQRYIFGLIQQLSIQRNIQQTIQQVGPRGARPHITMCMCMHMHMSETTATFLAKHELSSYTAAFDEHGWDSLPALQETSPTMT